MASLQQLLTEEGFEQRKKPTPLSKHRRTPDKSIALPIYICHDRKNFDFSKQKSVRRNWVSLNSSSKGTSLKSENWGSKNEVEPDRKSLFFAMQKQDKSIRRNGVAVDSNSEGKGMSLKSELEIDEVAVKAVISILSGYIGKFMKDENFREAIREKCYCCLSTKIDSNDSEIIEKIELCMRKIERLVENSIKRDEMKEMKVKSLSNSIRLLNIVESINLPNSKNGATCGVPNAYLCACAELYLSIVYKYEKKDRACARHLLQVFCVSPFLARTHLLPELWERFFLPHLLHLKVWYMKEVEVMSNLQYVGKDKNMKALTKVYNDRMDMGTKQFSLYYKEWLKTGVVKTPPIPSVSLPSISSKRRSSGSFSEQSSINKDLYQTVFGPNYERRTQSMELDIGNGDSILSDTLSFGEERKLCTHEDNFKLGSSGNSVKEVHRRSSSQGGMNPKAELWPAADKSDYLRIFSCRNEPSTTSVHNSHVAKNGAIIREPNNHHRHRHLPLSDFSNAITTICSSDVLVDCEISIRVVAKVWLELNGDPVVEASLSKAPVIEGVLEILFVSRDDEVLELAISILAELVSRSVVNGQIILNSDPQLEIFMRLLRNSSLFLKSSVLLYLLKPKAKQMLSMDWVPLVLRVLEFGDQLQTLFTVRCSPHVAAFYLLEQLLTGFDGELNIENSRKVVSLGGLSILVRRLETGGHNERTNAALFITSCIQADGSCRHYIANHVKKASILELLLLGNQAESSAFALSLLIELLCLNRTQATKFLDGLKSDGGYINTMHILLVYLQRAPPEQRPLVAAILLQLDLLGDHLQSSVYRDEVVDAIVEALDCKRSDIKVQEQLGRALLLLGGRFSDVGKASVENWLLKHAGFDERSGEFCEDNEMVINSIVQLDEEEEATEAWLSKASMVLVKNGNKRLLTALSESIENGIPCLARASLVTVAWMSSSLQSVQDANLQSLACSILVPQLLETLNYDRQLEERVLASLSLLSLIKNSGCDAIFSQLDKDYVNRLRNLSLVTWTAEELLAIVMKGANHWYTENEIIPNKSATLKLLLE